ncbi:hypothetical protein [Microbulbifer celer]|uniref:Uncharacterized protein n=1 Tax=Microbulbifer celer TaxID=435905 RepID=A0ABW3U6P0_9GAMM|nr:hypothetical protein [Microbulbifer celer]UFN58553.1 hypothetical protein LPW13_05790 [Microbulbifer celer]
MNSAEPVELSEYKFQRQIEAEREPQIEKMAQFVERRLLSSAGRLSENQVLAQRLFEDLIGDRAESLSAVAITALSDGAEAGMALARMAREVADEIAVTHYDEFENEAREWGWIE